LYSFNLGLRNGGGIADSMNTLHIDDPNFYFKMVFDMSFFVIINIISLNIIFGIIIDSFAELRDAQSNRTDDLINICFICGHSKDQFEKQGIDFNNHTMFDHNPLLYSSYLIFLKSKRKDEFDGIEGYVYQQWKKGRTNWAPILATETIKVEDEEEELLQQMSKKFGKQKFEMKNLNYK